jgi:hypothetical protein
MVRQHLDSLKVRPVGELPPIRCFATYVERKTADAVVGKVIRQNDRYVDGSVKLADPNRSADSSVASSDN